MFSIVIVNWNGAKLLNQCLDSLKKSKLKEFRLYIVDNGSTDESINIIEKYKKSLLIETIELDKNYGFAYANNIGIDKAMKDENEYIVTLNNDIEVTNDTLDILKRYIENNRNVDIFQLMMINYYERNKIDAAGLEFDENYFVMPLGYNKDKSEIENLQIEIEGACAGAAVYSKKALLSVKEMEIDYFSSDFFAYFEDVDLALRLKSKGFKTHLVKESIVYHMHSATGNKSSNFKDYYLSRNLFKYFKRNLSIKQYNISSKKGYKLMGKMFARYLVKGNLGGAKSILKGMVDYKLNR
ncbi:MAG: glycosyltransferase family 2 protein [Clostridium septicum]|uniref:glycosyltransferase family 2 protein n=1 Tax=Clostridium septicum TaxID=1504 RepID=UPI00258ADC46|nr:glycosyltransferase family 2 protein [Clostridium septicum]MDU1314684.1 glycosyltransferase family 2 protein [Clostridium septicum]